MTALAQATDASIDLSVYRLAAVKKASYRVAARCTVVLGSPQGNSLPIAFRFAPGTPDVTAREAVRVFFEELLDQELREQVSEETAPMRALILAQAYAKLDVIKRR